MKAQIQLPGDIEKICKMLADKRFEIAIVGGSVRDLLSGVLVHDWDLTTSATPEQILKIFKGAFYNNQFGTVGIPLESRESLRQGSVQARVESQSKDIVEITTYRTEESYSDSRHPDKVKWGESLDEDLSRRDFTINAIALRYNQGKLDLVDPYKGQTDLKAKVIRTVRDPDERFKEDALRILRAIRFATTLGFEIEPMTLSSIKKNAGLIAKISGERVRDELFKMVDAHEPDKGFFLAREIGVLKIILPELDACFEVPQKSPKRHHVYDVGTHCVLSLKFCPSKDTISRLATLLHDIGKAKVAKTIGGVRTFYNHEVIGGRQVKEIADRLHLSRDQKDKLFLLVRWHQFSVNENQTDAAIRRFIKNVGIDNVEYMMDLRVGDRLGGGLQQPESWRLKLFRQRIKEVLKKPFTVADLKIDGNDVMEILGLEPGPKVGEILGKLFEEVLEDSKKNNREYLLEKTRGLKATS